MGEVARAMVGRCQGCGFPLRACLCADIPRLTSRFQIVIVRHAAELAKTTGSARWAALALSARVIDHALPGPPIDQDELAIKPGWLLFPGGSTGVPPGDPPDRLVVPDGTWQQARRMVARLPGLRALPRLSLPAPQAAERLRRPHSAEGMSTIEAIASALEALGEPDNAAALRTIYRAAVQRTNLLKGRR